MSDSDVEFGAEQITPVVIDNGLLGSTDHSELFIWRMCHIRISSFCIINRSEFLGLKQEFGVDPNENEFVRISICMEKNQNRSLSSPPFSVLPPMQPIGHVAPGTQFLPGQGVEPLREAISSSQNPDSNPPHSSSGGSTDVNSKVLNALPVVSMDMRFSFRYLHTFKDSVDVIFIKLQRAGKRSRHQTIASAAILMSDLMQCTMDDDLVLTMKKDKAGVPLAKIHILAGTYPEHILSLESAQDYEFELLPEGQLFGVSSDEDGFSSDEEGDNSFTPADVLLPQKPSLGSPIVQKPEGSLTVSSPGNVPKVPVGTKTVLQGSDIAPEAVDGTYDDDDLFMSISAAGSVDSKRKLADTKRAARQALKDEKEKKEQEKKEQKEAVKKEKQEKKEKKEQEKKERKEQEKQERQEKKEKKEQEKKDRRERVKVPPVSTDGFVLRDEGYGSESDISASTPRGLGVAPPPAVPVAPVSIPEAGEWCSVKHVDRIDEIEYCLMFDASRWRPRKMALVFEKAADDDEEEDLGIGSKTLRCFGTKTTDDIGRVLTQLFERSEGTTHVAVLGSDRYIHDFLEPFLELSMNIPMSSDPVRFHIIPGDKTCDLAAHLATQDDHYKRLFYDDVWINLLQKRDVLTADEGKIVRTRVCEYLVGGLSRLMFNIGEANLTLQDSTSTPHPFIKAVQVSPMVEGTEVKDTAIDYYTFKKKGDHEQRHTSKLTLKTLVSARLPSVVRVWSHAEKIPEPTQDAFVTVIIEKKKPSKVMQVLFAGKNMVPHKKAAKAEEPPVSGHSALNDSSIDSVSQQDLPSGSGDTKGKKTRSDSVSVPPKSDMRETTSSGSSEKTSESHFPISSRSSQRGDGSPLIGSLPTPAPSSGEKSTESQVVLTSRVLGRCENDASKAPYKLIIDGVEYPEVANFSIKSNWRTACSFPVSLFKSLKP